MNRKRSKTRSAIPLVAAIVLVVVWFFAFHRPHSARLAQAREEKVALMDRQIELQSNLDVARGLVADLNRAEGEWCRLIRGLVVPDSSDRMVEILSQTATENDMSLLRCELNFAPLLRKASEQTAISPIEKIDLALTGRGRFLSVARFLASMDRQIIVAAVKDITLSYRRAIDPDVYLHLDMKAFVLTTDGVQDE